MARLAVPDHFLTHLPYALLVLSMLMNDMGWLRAVAIAAGLIRIVNRAFFDIDPIVVFWELVFVGVNVLQLVVLWYYAKRHRFSDEEQRFAAVMPPGIDRRTIRRLLRLAQMRQAEAGAALTQEGEEVRELLFLAEGVAQVEAGGRIVGVCGPGDFLGEMSFVSGAKASATAIAARPVRFLAFDQKKLRAAVDADADLRRAIDASLNANLVGKLAKANSGAAG